MLKIQAPIYPMPFKSMRLTILELSLVIRKQCWLPLRLLPKHSLLSYFHTYANVQLGCHFLQQTNLHFFSLLYKTNFLTRLFVLLLLFLYQRFFVTVLISILLFTCYLIIIYAQSAQIYVPLKRYKFFINKRLYFQRYVLLLFPLNIQIKYEITIPSHEQK